MRTSRTNQVRFHDQVRVKKIKPIGKNKSLHNDDNEDDILLEEDDVTDGGVDINFDEMEWSDEDEEMEDDKEGHDDDDDDENDENEENLKFGGRQTIERLKHDLFAEEEEEVQNGKCFCSLLSLNTNSKMKI